MRRRPGSPPPSWGEPPDDLGPGGVSLWRLVTARVTPNVFSSIALRHSCRVVDIIDRLEVEQVGAATSEGSSALADEVGAQRAMLAEMLDVAGLSEVERDSLWRHPGPS